MLKAMLLFTNLLIVVGVITSNILLLLFWQPVLFKKFYYTIGKKNSPAWGGGPLQILAWNFITCIQLYRVYRKGGTSEMNHYNLWNLDSRVQIKKIAY